MTDWSSALARLYLDFAGVLNVVDKMKGLFDALSESNHAVVPQHQDLKHTQAAFLGAAAERRSCDLL